MSDPARLSIALYPALSPQCSSDPESAEETIYHWSLVLSTGVPTGDSLVDEYQITTNTLPSFSSTASWKLSANHAQLLLPQLHGCILLPQPCIDISRESLSEFICEYTAWQGDYRLTGSRRWSCGMWILRIFEDLVEAGILDVELDEFESRVFQRGRELAAKDGAMRTVEY